MKQRALTIATTVALLAGCQCLIPREGLDRAYRVNPNSRTWTVYRSNDKTHIEKDHKFRIQREDNRIVLLPLFDLRHFWGLKDEAGVFVPLNKLTLTDDSGEEEYYCGLVDIKTPFHVASASGPTTQHGLLVAWTPDDTLELTFFQPDGTYEGRQMPSAEECTNRKFHGGTAHAEN